MLMGGTFVADCPHKSRAKRTYTQIAAPNQNTAPSQKHLEPTMTFSVFFSLLALSMPGAATAGPLTGLAAEAANSVVSFFASVDGQNADGYLDNLAATGMFDASFICCSTIVSRAMYQRRRIISDAFV
jgi:hypothetical protein